MTQEKELLENLICISDFEEAAAKILDQGALEFFASGADDEITLNENRRAFTRWSIRPRMLRDVSSRSMITMVMGKSVSFPLGVSPTGLQKLAHPQGEIANAKAAAAMDTIFILSTVANFSIEEVAAAVPGSRKWFQLYMYKDRNCSIEVVRRAEESGFEALVLTVDLAQLGKRRANIRHKFMIPDDLRIANFPKVASQGSSMVEYVSKNFDGSLTWADLAWLKSVTKLPIVVKGILTPEDAKLAVEHGAAAIFVSNHGGRQLDTVPATIDVLPEIVEAVKGQCEIYLDGGVTTGTDIFKALALGANMVFAGRPLLWGLSVGGEDGAKKVLELYKEELDRAMALAGVSSLEEINENYVRKYV